MKLNNKYYIMRHGQALSNERHIFSCWPEKFVNPLTEKGRERIEQKAKDLKKENINLIFSSDLLRARETTGIVSEELKLKPEFDERLREQNAGVINGQPIKKIREFFGPRRIERFKAKPPEGETYIEIRKRMISFLKDIDKKHKGKNILIISHEMPLILLETKVAGIPNKDFYNEDRVIITGEVKNLS